LARGAGRARDRRGGISPLHGGNSYNTSRGQSLAPAPGSQFLSFRLGMGLLDEVRDVGADAAVEERGILFRGGRCDVLSVDLGKTEYQPVDVLPDSGIRIQWSYTTSERRAR
jgi:hypothetical protein